MSFQRANVAILLELYKNFAIFFTYDEKRWKKSEKMNNESTKKDGK